MYSMNDAYSDVKLFNNLAGNLTNVTHESVDAQLSFCFEELSEAIESFEKKDMSNFVKEVCDMFVVTAGLLQKLAGMGVNIEQALKEVNENNLTKFPKTLSEADQKFAAIKGYKVEFNRPHSRYMLKDEIGKVKKPLSYMPANMNHVALGTLV